MAARGEIPVPPTIVEGIRVKLDWFCWNRFEEVLGLLLDAAEAGDRISKDEVEREEIANRIHNGVGVLFVREDTNEIVAFYLLSPCPLCRSYKPALFTGFTVIKKEFRGKGGNNGMMAMLLTLHKMVPQLHNEYIGMCSRTTIDNTAAIKFSKRLDMFVHGVIPRAIRLEGKGLQDNLIQWSNLAIFGMQESKYIMDEHSYDIPQVNITKLQVASPNLSFTPCLVGSERFTLNLASRDDLMEIELMIQAKAKKGNAFGVDEFTPDGIFCRRLFYDSHTFVVKNTENVLIAGCIYGPSRLGRSKDLLASCYVIMNEMYDKVDIVMEIMKYFIDLATEQRYQIFVQDVLMTAGASKTLNILSRLGFALCGSLPKCSYVDSKGFVDCFLLYKSLYCMSHL